MTNLTVEKLAALHEEIKKLQSEASQDLLATNQEDFYHRAKTKVCESLASALVELDDARAYLAAQKRR